MTLKTSLFRRGQVTEKAEDTLLRMGSAAPSGSLIVADSLFGGLKGLTKLVGSGRHGLLSCRRDRPGFIFKDYLAADLADGKTCACSGKIEGTDVPFIATMTQREKVPIFFSLFHT